MENKFYTIDQVAEVLDIHHKTVRKFIKDNIRIKYIYSGKGIGGEMSLGIGTFTNSLKNKFNGLVIIFKF